MVVIVGRRRSEDIVIGGVLTDSDNNDHIRSILAAWIGEGSHGDRVDAIKILVDVTDDGERNKLNGGSDTDLLFVGENDRYNSSRRKDIIVQII